MLGRVNALRFGRVFPRLGGRIFFSAGPDHFNREDFGVAEAERHTEEDEEFSFKKKYNPVCV